MRTIVDLPEEQVQVLDAMGKDRDLPRAELVRRAIDLYIAQEKQQRSDAAVDKYYGFLDTVPDAFGGLDGLSYEQKVRSEWDARDDAYGKWGMHEPGQRGYEDADKDQ